MAEPIRYLVVDASGEEQGPYTLDEVMSMLTSGTVSPDTLARPTIGPLRFQRLAALLAGPARAAAAAAAAAAAPIKDVDSGAGDSPETAVEWWYRDNAENERGPLGTAQMHRLIAQGFLDPHRDVKRGRNGDYYGLCQWPELAEQVRNATHDGIYSPQPIFRYLGGFSGEGGLRQWPRKKWPRCPARY